MATLRDIRRRIKAVENIKQITKSMEMVAAARLHKASAKAAQTKLFYDKMKEVLDHLTQVSEKGQHPFLQKPKSDNIGLLIVGADRGLSGPYNSNLYSAVERFLKNYDKNKVKLYIFGKRAVEHFQKRNWHVEFTQLNWGGKTTYRDIKKISDKLFSTFLEGSVSELWIAATEYVSFFTRNVVIDQFLPIQIKDENPNPPDFILEPLGEELLQEVVTRYAMAKIQAALDEAYASELAARVFSMGSATKNAQDVIQKLTLIRNKVRQASITKEMLEISASVEGMNTV